MTENNYLRDSTIELDIYDSSYQINEDTLEYPSIDERLQNARRLEYLDDAEFVDDNYMPEEYLTRERPQVHIYPEFCTLMDIGGVHSGRVMLYFQDDMHEDEDSLTEESDTSVGQMERKLLPARVGMKLTGGQFYMPQFLPILMKKEMSKLKLESLSSDLTRMFMANWNYYSEDNEVLKKKFIEMFKHYQTISQNIHQHCDVIKNDRTEREESSDFQRIRDSSSSDISSHTEDERGTQREEESSEDEDFYDTRMMLSNRYELFGMHTSSPHYKFQLPRLHMQTFGYVGMSQSLMTFWLKQIDTYEKPLMKFMEALEESGSDEHSGHLDVTRIEPTVKTLLVFCAEQLTSMFELSYMTGKITSRLKLMYEESSHFGTNITFITIPKVMIVNDISEFAKTAFGVSFGMNYKVLRLPISTVITDHSLKTNPNFIQPFHGDFNIKFINNPRTFFKFCSKVQTVYLYFQYLNKKYQKGTPEKKAEVVALVEAMDFQAPLELPEPLVFSAFEDIEPVGMSTMQSLFCTKMFEYLSSLLWDYYYYETFKQLKQRTFRILQVDSSINYVAEAWEFVNLPRNKNDLVNWAVDQGSQIPFAPGDFEFTRNRPNVKCFSK